MERAPRYFFAGLLVIALFGLAMYVRSERLAYQAARGAVLRQVIENRAPPVATPWPGLRR